MAELNHTVQDYFPIDSPIYYDQGWYYDASGLKYDGSMSADSSVKSIQQAKTDSISFTDNAIIVIAFLRSFDETLTITDNGEVKAFGQSQADTLSITDALAKAFSTTRADSISLTDTKAIVIALPKSDSISFTDTGETISVGVNRADSLSITDVGETKTISQGKSDGFTITDTGEVKAVSQTLDDNLTITDSKATEVSIPKADSISLADLISKESQLSNAEVFAIADNGEVKNIGVGQADTLSLSDSKIVVFNVIKSDSLSLLDSIGKLTGQNKADSIGVTDSGETKLFGLIQADNLAIIDALEKDISLSKTDNITFNDVFERIVSYIRAFDDTLSLADVLTSAIILSGIPIIFIEETKSVLNVKEIKPILNEPRLSAAVSKGVKVLYDAGYTYDQEDIYYDKWYSEDGELIQIEIPKLTTNAENVIMNIDDNKPIIKAITKKEY